MTEVKEGNINKIIHLDIPLYCSMLGISCQNPQVAVMKMEESTQSINEVCNFGFYCLFLKHIKCGEMQYGRTTYDYDEGTVVCIGRNQVVHCKHDGSAPIRCDALLFSPALIQGTPLARKMARYSYFAYSSNEALHLTEQEQQTMMEILDKIRLECAAAVDEHSRDIILMNIELLLEYCLRFYDRQFTTRQILNNSILTRFEELLRDYMDRGLQHEHGLPTVKYFADKICLSPNYFGDLVKRLTGLSPQEYILNHLIDLGKELLLSTDNSIASVSERLGFQYPQHFTRFFKKRTGLTPQEFRKA